MTEPKLTPQAVRVALSEFGGSLEGLGPETAMERAVLAAFESEGITSEYPRRGPQIPREWRWVGPWHRVR